MPPASPDPKRSSRCPHCGAAEAEVISLFGTQAITLQCRCLACGDLFEAVKYGEEAEEAGGAGGAGDRREAEKP